MTNKGNYVYPKGTDKAEQSVSLYFHQIAMLFSEKYALHLICFICFLKETYL